MIQIAISIIILRGHFRCPGRCLCQPGKESWTLMKFWLSLVAVKDGEIRKQGI